MLGVEVVVQHVAPLSPLPYVLIAKAEKSDLTMNSASLSIAVPTFVKIIPLHVASSGTWDGSRIQETQLPSRRYL